MDRHEIAPNRSRLRAPRCGTVDREGGGSKRTPPWVGEWGSRARDTHARSAPRTARDNPHVANGNRMVFLGFGKYARADKIYAIEPIRDERRGHGRRTLVWVEGVNEPIVASRTERTILADMGQDAALSKPLLDDALDLAERLAEQSGTGKVDLPDLGRRARRLLEATARPEDAEKLF
jgi:hypothetical protein